MSNMNNKFNKSSSNRKICKKNKASVLTLLKTKNTKIFDRIQFKRVY